MGFSKNRIIKIVVILVFLCCTLFANFFAVRMMFSYGVDAYFYDKLLVAYTIGGPNGLKIELDKIPSTDKLSRELILAKDFTARLATLKDPEAFLNDKVKKSKRQINLIKGWRSVAITFLFLIFVWQMIINLPARFKSKKSP